VWFASGFNGPQYRRVTLVSVNACQTFSAVVAMYVT
jgi:hypothetical protein